jgi:CreA protein
MAKRAPILTLALLGGLALGAGACGREGDRVGGFANDLTGNEIEIVAIADPAVPAVTCHFASFDRSLIDRLGKGNWFENPSNTAIDCHAAGPVDPAVLSTLPRNAEVFSQGTSLFFKEVAVRRMVDVGNRSIVYVSYARELTGASAKLGVSVVRLTPPPAPPATAATTAATAPVATPR